MHVVGTLGYRYFGRPNATWVDSFYMTFITVATIGFSEVVDLSAHPLGRLFTVAVAVVGIGTMTYLFSTFTRPGGPAPTRSCRRTSPAA